MFEATNKTKETGLSTELAPAYHIKTEPKGVKLQVGSFYTLSNGNGTYEVKIVSLRKLGDQIMVYYKYQKDEYGKWMPTWIHQSLSLDTFKVQLLEYGKIDSLELLYPTD